MKKVTKPRIKPTVAFYRLGESACFETAGYVTEIKDKSGVVTRVSSMLDGSRTVDQIADVIRVEHESVDTTLVLSIVEALDEAYLLEDADIAVPDELTDYDVQRWSRNFDFYGAFTKVNGNKYLAQLAIKNVRVGLLGIGGLGSHILYDLVALGVHDIRAVDFDKVDLSNLNRQILYTEKDIGAVKAEVAQDRIRQFNQHAKIECINKRITCSEDISKLIYDRDIVICVADRPRLDIVNWVNSACIEHAVPFIIGGLDTKRAVHYSVIPGVTGCVECWKASVGRTNGLANAIIDEWRRRGEREIPAPAIVHFVSVITGLITSEFIKLVTRIAEPSATNRLVAFDFVSLQVTEHERWTRDPQCATCGHIARNCHDTEWPAEVAESAIY